MSFVIALLLCLGDNCDLVRVESDAYYRSYEECSEAIAKKSDVIERAAAAHRETGQDSQIICLRATLLVDETDEFRKALVDTAVRDEPIGTAPVIGSVSRGQEVH